MIIITHRIRDELFESTVKSFDLNSETAIDMDGEEFEIGEFISAESDSDD